MSKIDRSEKGQFDFKDLAKSAIVGILAGLVAVLYRIIISNTDKITKAFKVLVKSDARYIIIWAVILLACSVIVWLLLRFEKTIGGSGIPQVKAELIDKLDSNWFKVLIAKIIAGATANIAGLSLGREGPSIQLGAMAGKGFAKLTKNDDCNKKMLISSGASAGLAAAFNAPFAGVMFALEEMHHNFSTHIMLSAITASITADFVSKCVFGLKPVFDFGKVQTMPLKTFWLLIIFGLLLGLFGVGYNFVMKCLHKFYGKIKSNFIRILIPFVLAGVFMVVLPQVLGSGHAMLDEILEGNFAIKFLVLILVVKFIFSMFSFCSGVAGGIFLPMLVMGALVGKIFGEALAYAGVIEHVMVINFVILGMVGFFTAIVRAPITGIILISEMTGSFSHMLPMLIVAVVAYIVAKTLKSKPVYDYLLDRLTVNVDNKTDE